MKQTDDDVSASVLGEWIGLTVKAVRGHPAFVRVGRDRFRLKASIKAYTANLRTAASGRGSPTAVARTRLIEAQASAAETKAAALRGELLVAAAVEREWSDILRTVRSGLLAVPSRCAGRLPHLSRADVAEIDSEVRAVLTALGRGDDAAK